MSNQSKSFSDDFGTNFSPKQKMQRRKNRIAYNNNVTQILPLILETIVQRALIRSLGDLR